MRLLIDSAVDYAIFTMTEDGHIDFWNAGAERMFGYGTDEIDRPECVACCSRRRIARPGHSRRSSKVRDTMAAPLDERFHVRKNGTRFFCSGVTTRLGNDAALGFVKIARDLTPQRDAADALSKANAGLEARVAQRTHDLQQQIVQRTTAQEHVTDLMHKLVSAQEEQRARIARDLHDQLGQQLTTLRLTLERLRDRATSIKPADDDLSRALQLTQQIDKEVDFLAWELRPAVLDDLGLAAALPQFVRDWSAHYGIPAEVRTSAVANGQLSRDVEVTFYRIAQEALNNVVKHAHATRADVLLEIARRIARAGGRGRRDRVRAGQHRSRSGHWPARHA